MALELYAHRKDRTLQYHRRVETTYEVSRLLEDILERDKNTNNIASIIIRKTNVTVKPLPRPGEGVKSVSPDR